MTQLTELEVLDANVNCDEGSDASRGDPPQPGLIEQSVQEEMLTLVPRLTRYARVLTHDTAAAEDLVQDCLASALRKIHMWEPGTDLRAWLFTILHHHHINRLRRDARHRASIDLQNAYQNFTAPPDQDVRLELHDVERALAQLPEQQRSLILVIGLEGMAYEDAASALNVPLGTVRSRISRGRQKLRSLTERFPAQDHGWPRRVAP